MARHYKTEKSFNWLPCKFLTCAAKTFEEEIFSNNEGPTCDQFSDIGYKCMPYQLCEDYTDDLLFLKQSEFVTIRSELSQQALAEIATCPDLSQVCCHDKKQSCNDFKDIDYRYFCYSQAKLINILTRI